MPSKESSHSANTNYGLGFGWAILVAHLKTPGYGTLMLYMSWTGFLLNSWFCDPFDLLTSYFVSILDASPVMVMADDRPRRIGGYGRRPASGYRLLWPSAGLRVSVIMADGRPQRIGGYILFLSVLWLRSTLSAYKHCKSTVLTGIPNTSLV